MKKSMLISIIPVAFMILALPSRSISQNIVNTDQYLLSQKVDVNNTMKQPTHPLKPRRVINPDININDGAVIPFPDNVGKFPLLPGKVAKKPLIREM
jgi:hypothetical protein